PLINAGSNALVPTGVTTDQRGGAFVRISGSAVDIGSLENQPASIIVTNANDSGTGSLRQAITDSVAATGADVITFDPTFFNVPRTITLASSLPQLTTAGGALTITGPGINLVTVSGNNAFGIFS